VFLAVARGRGNGEEPGSVHREVGSSPPGYRRDRLLQASRSNVVLSESKVGNAAPSAAVLTCLRRIGVLPLGLGE
jgi:hypothetical protein